MRLLFQFPKQIPTNFSKRMHSAKAKGTKINKSRSTIH